MMRKPHGCRDFEDGSDGTRTRDLQRDRPVRAFRGWPGYPGLRRGSKAFRPSSCSDCRAPPGTSADLPRDVRGMEPFGDGRRLMRQVDPLIPLSSRSGTTGKRGSRRPTKGRKPRDARKRETARARACPNAARARPNSRSCQPSRPRRANFITDLRTRDPGPPVMRPKVGGSIGAAARNVRHQRERVPSTSDPSRFC